MIDILLAGLAMMLIQLNSGLGLQWVVPVAFLVVVSAFLALQIKAARIHTSVELTPETLRQGVETIRIDEIVSVYPEPRNPSRNYLDTRMSKSNALTNRALRRAGLDESDLVEPEPDPGAADEADAEAAAVQKWQSARALGELTGVPRGRTGIGLKLTGGGTAQAWAGRHRDRRRPTGDDLGALPPPIADAGPGAGRCCGRAGRPGCRQPAPRPDGPPFTYPIGV